MKEYQRTTFHGKETDYRTAVMATRAEKTLGQDFVCWQGSYSTSVGASAGTHAGGGALDLSVPGDPDRITRVLRKHGFAAWYRTPAQGFTIHIHCIDIGNTRLSTDAHLQVQDFNNGGDGLWPLVGSDDPQPWRPSGPDFAEFVDRGGFDFDAWRASQNLRQKIGGLTGRIKELVRRRSQAKRRLDKVS